MIPALIALALLLLSACAPAPVPADPYSPWFNIPKPTKCGPRCEEWVEPDMFVHEVQP